jgi:hypothetical protein
MQFSQNRSKLSADSYFAEAIAAVDRSALAGLEGNCSFLATVGANGGEHLARRRRTVATISVAVVVIPEVVTIIAVALRFSSLTAIGAALGLVGIASGVELLLLLSAKGKGFSAIGTSEGFILKTHWMPSSLKNLVRARVIQYLIETVEGFKKLVLT